ncbi:MAG: hypothetical protein Q9187_000872 [Circinaria calcarea]
MAATRTRRWRRRRKYELERLGSHVVTVLAGKELLLAFGLLGAVLWVAGLARLMPSQVDNPISSLKRLDDKLVPIESGMLHAEDKDFNTAFSYFIEALEGYRSQEAAAKATSALQYMLLCKIMLNLVDDVKSPMAFKQAQKYSGKNLKAMKAVARAHSNRSLEDYEKALSNYRYELGSDPFIRNHLRRLYDAILEQNLIQVIEPFSRVEIEHIAAS